jgi:hypothetical protein
VLENFISDRKQVMSDTQTIRCMLLIAKENEKSSDRLQIQLEFDRLFNNLFTRIRQRKFDF